MGAIATQLETTVVRESADTLRLYMATLPGPGQVEWAPYELGEVIDNAGLHYLVEAPSVPADVRASLDAGLTVEKFAPAPAETAAQPDDLSELAESDLGGLRNQVDSDRIASLIAEFQAMGAADGGSVGTRHYTTIGSQIAAEFLYRELESYGFDVWYEEFLTWQGYLVVNVVGELPGRDTGRLYGVMAHFDSISDSPTVAAPGADDNATGMASALEIARVLSGYDLAYSLQVAFVNVEEEGIIGAEEYARNSLEAGAPLEGVFNLDSIGSSRHGDQIMLNATGDSIWMQELIQRVNSGYGIGESILIHQSDEIVADDNRLREEGVEAVLVARELYGMSPVHHTERDVIENVSMRHTRSATELVLVTVGALLV
ncbi:MAG TPA: M28 family peptidase [Thermomicrobiales bacterium]|nr:M28 family peptidase [Thermomicrobiales bacterium]